MKVIGIIGGIASGKSAAAEEFYKLGAEILDADKAGHNALNEPEVLTAITKRWGEQMVDSDGKADRKEIAKIVFADSDGAPKALAYLEGLTHPRIKIALQTALSELNTQGVQCVILDAALLMETGWSVLCDEILYVEVEDSIRKTRALGREWTEDQLALRESAQWSLAKKSVSATASITNNDSLENLRKQIYTLWDDWITPNP